MLKNIIMSLGVVVGASATVHAGTATANMNVSAEVSATCSISAGALAFGAYDTVTGAQVDGTATLQVACTKGATASIMLGQGTNADTGSTDDAPLRRMNAGANMLAYALFADSSRLQAWGNTAGTGVEYVSASSVPSDITVFGRIAAGQDVPSGAYSDVVLATVSF